MSPASWTYGGSPSTASSQGRRDIIRLLIRDTNSSRQLLSDEEIAFYYAQENNVWRAAAAACLALADAESVDKTVGDLSISGGSKLTNYLELAKRYNARADMGALPYAGGISAADKQAQEDDSDRVVPSFTRTMHDDAELIP